MYGIQNGATPLIVGGKTPDLLGKSQAPAPAASFQDLLKDSLRSLSEMEAQKENDSLNLALGDMDNLAAMMANAERAQVAFQMLVQMRNKVLDGYSEIMRLNL